MKKKFIIILVAVLTIAVVLQLLTGSNKKEDQEKYQFANVERGDLESIVSSTGTLYAVTTVKVGTQVSGKISKVLVDFNDKVKQGDLLAQLDMSVLTQAVYDAENSVERAKLQYDQMQMDLNRIKILFDQQLKTQNDLDLAQYNFNVARSNMKSAQSNLEKAKINLSYANVYSPIDGTVIARKIDVGQTVAASFSTPDLFSIANDLSKMQIQANVDESDIGQIKQDQKTRFTVQAYPNEKFEGQVTQIRLEPQTVSNVVNYTVVVNVDNSSGKLLPGMTATVDFIIGQAKGVLKVPNASLRIRPSEDMIKEVLPELEARFKERAAARGASGADFPPSGPGAPTSGPGAAQPGAGNPTASSERGSGNQTRGQGGSNGSSQFLMRMLSMGSTNSSSSGTRRAREFALLWYFDEKDGKLHAAFVRTGLTDGSYTEVRSDSIKEGLQIIKSINEDLMGGGGRPPMMRMF